MPVMVNDGLFQQFARIHSDKVLPSQNFGWLEDFNVVANVPIGTIFRPRITISRRSRTTQINLTFRLQFQRNLSGSFIFVTDVSDFCKLIPTVRFRNGNDSLDLLLTTDGFINDFDNNAYISEGDGETLRTYTFPPNEPDAKFEPEWSCIFHGSTLKDDSFRFRSIKANGDIFPEGYSQFGLVDAKDPIIDRVPKFKTEISQVVNLVSKINPAVRMKSNIIVAVNMCSSVFETIRIKTEISKAVDMRTEVC